VKINDINDLLSFYVEKEDECLVMTDNVLILIDIV